MYNIRRVPIRLRNDLYCVGWGVKLYSLTRVPSPNIANVTEIKK